MSRKLLFIAPLYCTRKKIHVLLNVPLTPNTLPAGKEPTESTQPRHIITTRRTTLTRTCHFAALGLCSLWSWCHGSWDWTDTQSRWQLQKIPASYDPLHTAPVNIISVWTSVGFPHHAYLLGFGFLSNTISWIIWSTKYYDPFTNSR